MFEIINQILFRFQNIIEIIPSELQTFNLNMVIGGGVWFLAFYFLSRWFRAYVIRLALFILGVFLIWNVTARDHMLDNIDIYVAFGLLIPQIPIVELTYLIIRERTLFMYGKILELILLIASPFVWLFNVSRNFLGFFKAKQEEKAYNQDKAEYERKSRKFKEGQSSNQQKQKTYQEPPKQKKQKTYQWWESPSYYERLQLNENATKDEMKKAKKRLRKLYHPDLVFTNEEKRKKYTIIFQNVNNAYDELMKKF